MNDFAFHRGVSRNARTGSVGTPVIKSNRRLTTFFFSSGAAIRAIRAGYSVDNSTRVEEHFHSGSFLVIRASWVGGRGHTRYLYIERQNGLNNIDCTKLRWRKIVEKYDANLEKFVIINLNDN